MILLAAFLISPLVLHAAMLAPGLRLQYECVELENQIQRTRLDRRALTAKREQLLEPALLQRLGARLGLAPAESPDEYPLTAAVILQRDSRSGDAHSTVSSRADD